ncbi:unnamed protein product [Clavelina lepadiformis]|uniref:Ubiquitin-like domain-containing protein n=1 Tax=Clavelina lepadiformis TaxID=159417 RepID=A0ABP0G3T7_CLALP
MTSAVTDSDVDEYLSNLEELSRCDLSRCDQKLLRHLLKSFDTFTPDSVTEQSVDFPIVLDLYVQDMASRKGPFKIICRSSWTCKDVKKKISESFLIPTSMQKILVKSRLFDNGTETLNSCGITKTGDRISLFLKHCESDEEDVASSSSSVDVEELQQKINLQLSLDRKLEVLPLQPLATLSSDENQVN